MKNPIKKRLLAMLLAFIIILPWTQPNTDSVSTTDSITYEQDITCYSTQVPPDEKPIIIKP